MVEDGHNMLNSGAYLYLPSGGAQSVLLSCIQLFVECDSFRGCLVSAAETPIMRHVKVKGYASPFNRALKDY